MVFEDIFSNKKKSQSDDKPLIIVDVHEKNSLVVSQLVSLGARIVFEHLDIGDYLINNFVIERKTLQDFVSSIINKRLVKQLINLRGYDSRLLLIEGGSENTDGDYRSKISANAIRGFILSSIIDYSTPVIMTKDYFDTANFLFILAKKLSNNKSHYSSLRPSRKFSSMGDKASFVLEGFPGVGPSKSKLLLEKFGSIRGVINSPLDDLSKILGLKADDFLSLANYSKE